MLIDGIAGLSGRASGIVVIGSGPVGLAFATDISRRGIPVLVLESGGRSANPAVQALSAASRIEPARHDDMSVAVARRLGGSSNLWGGRCIPYDRLDFEDRPRIPAHWPIGYDDLSPYWARATAATQSGAPVFMADAALAPGADDDFSADVLERWANIQAAHVIHKRAIATDPALELRTHATAVGLIFDVDGRVTAIDVAHSLTGERTRLPVATLVLAAGGLETTRLLLAAQRQTPDRFGGRDGPLGRYYMGHLLGEIADIVFSSVKAARAFDFYVDNSGSYVRRRFAPSAPLQARHGLLNSAFWPIVAPVADAEHGSAILSLVYLALSFGPLGRLLTAEAIRRRHIPDKPTDLLRHIANVVTNAPSALAFSARFLHQRYGRAERLPGFFVLNKANRYRLSYHSEHLPNPSSRAWLTDRNDRLGLPSLAIDLRFAAEDAASLVKTHDLLSDWLTRSGIGRIDYRVPIEARAEAILAQAAHGTHQLGLTRMARGRNEGIVDGDLRCFDVPNLHIASTSVLPTSSQANPTLTAVALALRLADHIGDQAARPLVADAERRTAVG